MDQAAQIANRIRLARPDFTLEKFSQSQPYRNPDTLEQLLTTLRKAGLR
jgi:hypothetical protein